MRGLVFRAVSLVLFAFDLDEHRHAVCESNQKVWKIGVRCSETSLRAVADEIGMSFSGLKSFLDRDSDDVHRKTREKLVRWYYARSKHAAIVPQEDVETAVALLRTYLRDESKPRAVRERQLRELIVRLEGESD